MIENVSEEMSAHSEESFGPIVTISRFADDEDAVRRANEEGVNLTASVWAGSNDRAEQVASGLRAGAITLNGHGVAAGAAWAPWGGVGESGFGRVNGAAGLREFSVPVHVMTPLNSKLKQPFWYPYDEPSENLIRGVTKLLGAPDIRTRLHGFREIASNFGRALKGKL